MDVGSGTPACNGGLDEKIELLVILDGELEVSGANSPDHKVLASVSGELEDLSDEVLENSSSVDSSSGADSISDERSAL